MPHPDRFNSLARAGFPALLLWLCAACAPVLSPAMLSQSDPGATVAAVAGRPDAFKGKTVIWGGSIVAYDADANVLTILERPLDSWLQPQLNDQTGGRFLAWPSSSADSKKFVRGRKITLAGEVIGVKKGLVDTAPYVYPAVRIKEYHLWPNEPPRLSLPSLGFSFGVSN